jgi:YVTN family beta-propeller protein
MIYKLKYLLLGFSVISCVKLNPEEVNTNITLNGNGLVLIGNEGNFQNGNASLSSYNINTQQTTSNIYQAINQEVIGDVLHSIYHSDHLLYLVVNNSGKVIAIDDESLEKKMEIRNLISPRKIIKVDNSKFYISDLYASEVTVYNNYDGAVGKIPVDGWCEDIIIQNGKAYISNITNNQLYVVNTSNDNIFDSISVGSNPISIKEDSRGNIWVLCQGNLTNNENPSISIIETNTNLILKSFSLTNNFSYPSSLEIDIQTNQIYFINKHIYKIQNLDDTVANEIWFNNNNNFYNLKINPYTKDVYITDAKDYVQNGTLYIIDSIGKFVEEIATGIIPKSIVF